MNTIEIDGRTVGPGHPAYFIADIAANHDGDLERAKILIELAHANGADAVKFQHHNCTKYVSDVGFRSLGGKFSHQSQWTKSVYEVYKDAEVPVEWTPALAEFCREIGVTFFSTPYDLDMVDHLDAYVPAFKIGSGDLIWDDMLVRVAKTGKPVIFASGACELGEVQRAVGVLEKHTSQFLLMQCNTNYTASDENMRHLHLNVLKTYAALFPGVPLGLSDHTHGSIAVLGAIALGACAIERHFTDDNNREGPDHKFAVDAAAWKQMVDDTRLLELAMGSPRKVVCENEQETVVLQRRAIRAARDLSAGETLTRENVEFQRPSPPDALYPNEFEKITNKALRVDVKKGEHIALQMILP